MLDERREPHRGHGDPSARSRKAGVRAGAGRSAFGPRAFAGGQEAVRHERRWPIGRSGLPGRALAGLLGLVLALSTHAETGREVPGRALTVPSTVSEELARVMAKPAPFLPTPRTTEEWHALQARLDGARGEQARELAAATGARIEEETIAGVRCYRVTPAGLDPANANRLLVHTHGGAYVLGAGVGAALEAVLVANASQTVVLSIDYRMPPDHPFPAALDDAIAVWQALSRTTPATHLALFGTSAGGGLAMATVHRLKALGQPLPAVMFIGTPASDITKTGDSYFTNAEVCNGLGRYEGFLEDALKLYAGDADLRDPLLSPVYGDFRGFPPTVLVSGTRDLLLSNTVRVHRKLREAGVAAELHVYEGQSHADYLAAPDSPESRDAFREVAAFFDRHLAR